MSQDCSLKTKSAVTAASTKGAKKDTKEYSIQHKGKVVTFKTIGENLIRCETPDHLPQVRLEAIMEFIETQLGVKRDSAQLAPSGVIHFELKLEHTNFKNFTKELGRSIVDKMEEDRLHSSPGSIPRKKSRQKKQPFVKQPKAVHNRPSSVPAT